MKARVVCWLVMGSLLGLLAGCQATDEQKRTAGTRDVVTSPEEDNKTTPEALAPAPETVATPTAAAPALEQPATPATPPVVQPATPPVVQPTTPPAPPATPSEPALEAPAYPAGPYATQYLDTAFNVEAEECLCEGTQVKAGRKISLANYLDKKATLVAVHSGTCPYCKQQAASMEKKLQAPLGALGLGLLVLIIGDDKDQTDREKLLAYCCKYKSKYKMTFPVAIDPEGASSGQFIDGGGIPFNLILDPRMQIRFKMEGYLGPSQILEGLSAGIMKEPLLDPAQDNQLSGTFKFKMNTTESTQVSWGKALGTGNVSTRAVYMEDGYAFNDSGQVTVTVVSLLTGSLYQVLSLSLPPEAALGTPVELTEDGPAQAALVLVEFDADGKATNETPVGRAQSGRVELTAFGQSLNDPVEGSFQVSLKLADPR